MPVLLKDRLKYVIHGKEETGDIFRKSRMVGRAQKIQSEGTGTKSGKRRRVSNGTKRRLKAKIIVAGMFLLEMKTEPQQKPDLPAGTVVVSTGGTAKTGFTFASSVSWYPQLASATLRYICAMGAPRTAQPEVQGSRQDNCVAWTLRGMECMTRDADLGLTCDWRVPPSPGSCQGITIRS